MHALDTLRPVQPVVRCRCDVRCYASTPMARRSALRQLAVAGISMVAGAQPAKARQQQPVNKEVDAAESPYIQELLRKSRENKAQYDRERLQDYYKRNFKDYFEFESGNTRAGTARGVSEESQQAIQKWLQENK